MTHNGKVIVETFRQMQEIYEQVSNLLTAANTFMQERQWIWENSYVLQEPSNALRKSDRWLPSIIRCTYINNEHRALRKYIAVKIVSENRSENREESEPVVIGTTLLGREETPEFRGWDAHWWWEQVGDGIIEQPTKLYESEDRELAEIHMISHPLVDITSSDKLQGCIIAPFLIYNGSDAYR